MMDPVLAQTAPAGGPPYDDTELRGRVVEVEDRLGAKANSATVTVVSNRVKAIEDADALGHISELVYLGTHAITAGTVFDRAALLASPFLAGKDLARLRFDLQLVGGGASGGSFGDVAANVVNKTTAVAIGGKPGTVRILRGLKEVDFVDGLTIQVGAGGAPATGAGTQYGSSGGNTKFGWITAIGGRSYLPTSPAISDTSGATDVALGQPGCVNGIGVPFTAVTSTQDAGGRSSLGPGGGGGATGQATGAGGASNEYDTRSATARINGTAGGAGGSAPADSSRYGTGGNGSRSNATPGGAGGFPGGGGGGVVWPTDTGTMTNPGSGAGGAGVIRIHCYELVEVR